MQRRHEPLPVDEAEGVGEADEKARVEAHLGSVPGQHLVDEVADRGPEVRALEGLDQRLRHRFDQPLIPALLARDLEHGRQHRRDRVRARQTAQPRGQVAGRRRRDFQGDPLRDRAYRGGEIGGAKAPGGPREQIGQVEALDLPPDVVLGEDAVAHHHANALRHQLPVGGDDRGVGDGKPEGMPEEGGHREPVGEPAHDAGLGDGQDPPTPPRGAEGYRRHREPHCRQQHEQGEPSLAGPPCCGYTAGIHARSLLWEAGRGKAPTHIQTMTTTGRVVDYSHIDSMLHYSQ